MILAICIFICFIFILSTGYGYDSDIKSNSQKASTLHKKELKSHY